ncbi:PLP-dependent aminotransferase family protein [Motiliproteus coralliicola]|uniref:PLP-dependent aminotransferase family protein n=1 Tax=Motiliproteus coralliicola TaxID=2283196 RepID=A0A369WEB1_9GAMM|nr:PLP-dependent aminotransferase family protein [Motiliproteus coralliicola]RDE19489.1 PLP-dependent aminotransferase family protein [Motiliproteus coralliicola]
MVMISINQQDELPLVEQVVRGVSRQIDERVLRQGARLPSIRQFANDHRVSRFTVVQAYDRLVAAGYLESRQGSGFYVSKPVDAVAANEAACDLDRAVDILWLLRQSMQQRQFELMPGCGWLPPEWQDASALQRGLRTLARGRSRALVEYGNAFGYLPLRQDLQQRLGELEIAASPNQIVTTHGVSQALDLLFRYFIRPGDKVLVEDPAYFNLFGPLKLLGAELIGVPRNQDGPDTAKLEQLIQQHHPKLMITTAVLHNPTGTCISQAVAYRLLQLAEKYQLMIIEDDIYGDFHGGRATRLAALDQLNRVIYVSSFSKTISASVRVGYLACHPDLAQELVDLKLLTQLTSCETSERLIHQILSEGHYRKSMMRLRSRLERAREQTIGPLESLGMGLYAEPEYGFFLWTRLPSGCEWNAAELAHRALESEMMLAPGNIFSPQQSISPWLRFNAAFCADQPQVFERLKPLLECAASDE